LLQEFNQDTDKESIRSNGDSNITANLTENPSPDVLLRLTVEGATSVASSGTSPDITLNDFAQGAGGLAARFDVDVTGTVNYRISGSLTSDGSGRDDMGGTGSGSGQVEIDSDTAVILLVSRNTNDDGPVTTSVDESGTLTEGSYIFFVNFSASTKTGVDGGNHNGSASGSVTVDILPGS
jgi:hypothetical protein